LILELVSTILVLNSYYSIKINDNLSNIIEKNVMNKTLNSL